MKSNVKLTNSPEWLLGLPVKTTFWIAIAITMSLLVGQLH
jgi:hypothetical protein